MGIGYWELLFCIGLPKALQGAGWLVEEILCGAGVGECHSCAVLAAFWRDKEGERTVV